MKCVILYVYEGGEFNEIVKNELQGQGHVANSRWPPVYMTKSIKIAIISHHCPKTI